MASPTWTVAAWRELVAAQQPDWPDESALELVLKQLATYPRWSLPARHGPDGQSGRGGRWEGLPAPGRRLRRVLRHLLGRRHPGQAAPHPPDGGGAHLQLRGSRGQGGSHRRAVRQTRSAATERVGEVDLPSFRGHMVNDMAFTTEARMADPTRLLTAYHQASSTLNLLRAFTKGASPTSAGCTPGTRSSSPPVGRAGATRSSPTGSSGPCGSWRPVGSTSGPSTSSTRSTSTPATKPCSSATRRP